MIGYTIYIFAVSVAVCCMSYDTLAVQKGWPVGEILAKDASLPKITAIITVLWAMAKSFLIFHWWSPILVLVVGWFFAFGITNLLQKHTQIFCIIGIYPALLFTIFYISEDKPLGIIHKLFS